jgi:signal transduction histidine kinase
VESRDYKARRLEAEHVGFVTHELRNPLTTAALMASTLRQKAETSGPTRELDILIRSLDRLGGLIDSVLLVERLDAKEVTAQPRDETLGELMAPAVEAARLHAAAKDVQLEVEGDLGVLVHADPGLTQSVVGNLLDNAAKYTNGGTVRLVAVETPREVIVHVYDSCDGLSAEELKTIFEPFQRAAHKGEPGTGLGLAIARRAVEAQGGMIAADSDTERGCHFWFTLQKARQ